MIKNGFEKVYRFKFCSTNLTKLICTFFALQIVALAQQDVPSYNMSKIGDVNVFKILNQKILNKSYPSEKLMFAVYLNEEDLPKLEWDSKYINGSIHGNFTRINPDGFGFALISIGVNDLDKLIGLDYVQKVKNLLDENKPQANESARFIHSNILSDLGITGKGVRVCILDSGLDLFPINEELPENIIYADFSNFPEIDTDIENQKVSHGTLITSLICGNGLKSSLNILNGGGAYKGIAPGCELIFLKIGNDYSGSATTASIVAALDAAVNVYDADIINLSYGSWDLFHDGSSPKDEKVDWCFDNGVPVITPTGNLGNSKRHFSEVVSANSQSDFIKLIVNPNDQLYTTVLNLVWYEKRAKTDLNLIFYNEKFDSVNSNSYPIFESTRGACEKLHFTTLDPDVEAFYIKIQNHSDYSIKAHIYEQNGDSVAFFDEPDSLYTLVSPSTADKAFSVGGLNIRNQWTGSDFIQKQSNIKLKNIADYSGRGPRIDGLMKPDILAPSSMLITLDDRDISANNDFKIDDDGISGGEANYRLIDGTSYSAAIVTAAAALILEKNANTDPKELFALLREGSQKINDDFQNYESGYGVLDVQASYNLSRIANVSVNDSNNKKRMYAYPNPFNPRTKINYYLDKGSEIKLQIFNSMGQLAGNIFNGYKAKGNHSININASDLTSGIYFISLWIMNSGISRSLKIALIK